MSLITVEVHARDVVDRLVRCGASSPADFEWASQLRFYWDREANDAVVKQVRGRLGGSCGDALCLSLPAFDCRNQCLRGLIQRLLYPPLGRF